MPKYDFEDLLNDVLKFLKANLPAAIDAAEAEQVAKGYVATGLPSIPTEGWFLQGFNSSVMNVDTAVLIAGGVTGTEGSGPYTRVTYGIDVAVFNLASQNDAYANEKAMRYAKALQNCFEDNWSQIKPGLVREKLETVASEDLKVNGRSNEPVKASGVVLTVVLG